MTTPPPAGTKEPWLQAYGSRDLCAWLARERCSLVFTTYQTGKVFLVGLNAGGQLAVFERTFNRAMGLWVDERGLWLGSLYQLWHFVNVLEPGNLYEGHDRLYVPRTGWTTGDIDIHDVAVDRNGRVVFVATKFNCLATLSERYSFTPLWRPPFVSRLAPEDRCHLNGLALEDGMPRYATAVSASDVTDAWRDRRQDGGVVVDVQSNEIVARGLSMPHSPRVHQGQLWLLNSGAGFLGKIDRARQAFEPVCFCPGYLRGLAFAGNYAVVGLSQPRHDKTFGGLPLDKNLAERQAEARCALHVINLITGDTEHWLRLEGMVTELYDVAVIPEAARPMALGFKSDEIQRLLTVGPEGTLQGA
jgi:uncharacterized protein (TIGR03032 family)